ncbi:Ig-like domain-containing protein [Mycolicibacterium sp. P9-22]|uniref:Ig-like domain-containing protein n=1 Tax=Mycolicibacterium sp. P9-22 TaxID=2024613 RepID=UPI0011EEFDF8|nr:Ig-like domain-containing protein [Mycolicibacterium sp. P9-22]
MKATGCVSQAGGIIVALGLGVAVSCPVTAVAEPSGSVASETSPSADTSPPESPDASPDPQPGTGHEAPDTATENLADPTPSAEPDDVAGELAPEADESDEPEVQSAQDRSTSGSGKKWNRRVARSSTGAVTATPSAADGQDTDGEVATARNSAASAVSVSVSVSPSTTPASAAALAEDVHPVVTRLGPDQRLAMAAAQGVPGLDSALNSVPSAPIQAGLWGLLAWVRRELDRALVTVQRTFFNRTPTTNYLLFENTPVLNTDGALTAVSGDLKAQDADGDALTYRVVQTPGDGSVVVNPDGTFLYTPSRELLATGGTDVFTVETGDVGNHLHLPNIFTPGFGRTTTTTVEVLVDPTCPSGCQLDPIKVIATIPVGQAPDGVAFTPDGSRAYVANALSNSVSVINVATDTVIATIAVGENPRGVAVNPVSPRVYVTNLLDGTVSVINTNTNTVIATIPVGTSAERVAVSGGGSRLYVIGSQTNGSTMSVISTATNTVIAAPKLNGTGYGLAVHPNGGRVFVATQIDWLDIIDTVGYGVTHFDTDGGWMRGVAFNPLGTRVYLTHRDTNTVTVRNTSTNALITTIPVGADPYGIAMNPAGTRLLVVNQAGQTLSVIRTSTNTVIKTLDMGFDPDQVAISPDGTRRTSPPVPGAAV